MARNPVSVYRRPTKKKGQYRYYLKLWDEKRGQHEERPKEEEKYRFIDNSFHDGVFKTTDTDIDRIMPLVSRFGGQSRKQGVVA